MLRDDGNKKIVIGIGLLILGALMVSICVYLLVHSDKDKSEDITPTPTITQIVTPVPTPTKKPTIVWDGDKGNHTDGPGVTIDPSGSVDESDEEAEVFDRFDDYIQVKPDGSITIDFDSYTKDNFGEKSEESE